MEKMLYIFVLLLIALGAHAETNPIWAQKLAQAERLDDQQMQRVLKFVSSAGNVVCLPEWQWCLNGPGVTHVSCCGRADAYETDKFHIDRETHALVATLTCNDPVINCPENIPKRIDRKPGTEFVVPKAVVLVSVNPKDGKPAPPINDTGHGWIWVNENNVVVCWSVPPGE